MPSNLITYLFRFSREATEMKLDDITHSSNLSISVMSTIFFLLCLIVIGSVNYIASVTNDVIKSFIVSSNSNKKKSTTEDSSKDLDSTIFSNDDAIDYYPMCPVAPL